MEPFGRATGRMMLRINKSSRHIEGYGQWRSAVDGSYDGNFSKGLKSGTDKMWFSDGTVYDGQWSGGDFVG